MMKNFILLTLSSALLFSCGTEPKEEDQGLPVYNPKLELTVKIAEVEKKMHASPQIDNVLALQALQLYFEYAKTFPTDSLTPDYYFKSAEINTAIQQYPQAYANYQIICESYPKYKLIEESYFLQASILDNYLNEDEKARPVYEALIRKFPASKYVPDAKSAISNLGKSDAELIKEFEKKNAGK